MPGFQFTSESFVDGKAVKIGIKGPSDPGEHFFLMSSEEAIRLASTILASVKVRISVSIKEVIEQDVPLAERTVIANPVESKDAKAPNRTRRRR